VGESRYRVCGCGVRRSVRVKKIVGDLLRGVRLAIYSELAGVVAAGQAVAASSRAERAPWRALRHLPPPSVRCAERSG
jgi:hypothetical protein